MTEPHRLSTRDGLALHFRWTPARQASSAPPLAGEGRPAVLITHGLGEHSSRYWHVEEHLAACGFGVALYDLRGHGRSEGRRGDAPGFQSFLDDLDCVIAAVRQRLGPSPGPLFLYGHSLGGLITLRFLLERPRSGVRGAIAASPWLQLAFAPARWKLCLAALARFVWPGFRQITGVDPRRLSRDATFLAAMPDLHLSHHRLSARLFHEILRACKVVAAGATQIREPLLLLHGQADPVTSWIATHAFYQACASTDKSLKLYPGVFHETHNDLDRSQVLADVSAWLLQHAAPLPPRQRPDALR